MTFVNAGILTAFVAVVLPFLIHLFSRQRLRDIEFSSLKFLKRLERKRMRRVRLTEWILLALRTIALGCLILAFARPAIQKLPAFKPGEAHTAAALLFDNSLSSQAVIPQGSIISLERQRALEVLNLFSFEDKILLLSTAEPVKLITTSGFPGKDQRLYRLIYELESTDSGVNWSNSLKLIAEFFRNSDQPNKELYIFSPFYQEGKILDSTLALLSKEIRVFKVVTGPEKLNNLALVDIEIETRIMQVGSPVSLLLKVMNYGNAPLEGIPLSLFLGKDRVGYGEISVPAGGEASLKMKLVPEKGGFVTGYAKLELEDAILVDNIRYFSFYVADKVEVYISGETKDVERVESALKPQSERDYAVHPIELSEISQLNDYLPAKVVFLAGLKKISNYEAGILERTLRRGGGIIITPSLEADIATLDRDLLRSLGAPQYGELVMGDEGISWGYIDYQHPIFEGIFADKPALESPNFMGHFRLLGTGGNAVISFRNGEVFLKEVRIGEGAILIFTAGLGDEWGDFSNRGIFAPLLHRAVVYLGSRGENGIKPLVAGTPIEYWVETSQKKYRLCLPDGQSMDLIPSVEGKMLKLKYSDTSIAGICILQQNDSLFAEFAVNPDVQGSKLERETKDKDRDNITISDEKNLADIVQVGRLGQELWRWFLLIGLGCLLLEMLIVRLSQKG